MVVKSLFEDGTDHDAVFAEGERVIDQHEHPSLQWVRDDLQELNIDLLAVCGRMREHLDDGRWAQARRISAEARYGKETDEVKAVIDEVDAWVQQLHQLVRSAVAFEVPGASGLLKSLLVGRASIDTYERTPGLLIGMIVNLEMNGADVLALKPSVIVEGKALAAKLHQERHDVNEVELLRSVYADAVEDAIVGLAEEAEKIAHARKLVELRTGRELPGFHLGYLRTALARRRGGTPEPVEVPADAAAPVTDTTPTAGSLPGLPGLG